ncbi:hypothetical protein AG4045_006645 [Apium graveolens]|uniref:Uncharacterized protein n=1 Tax=Apium graveolens TaxID=4045 RepID=A0A6L5BAW4_APIGR|nr:hypothetical protein AG4045_006645 [Apium graveolens]
MTSPPIKKRESLRERNAMAGGTASVNDVANNVGRESSSVDLGEMERESGDDEIGGKIRVRNGVIAVVSFDNGVKLI